MRDGGRTIQTGKLFARMINSVLSIILVTFPARFRSTQSGAVSKEGGPSLNAISIGKLYV